MTSSTALACLHPARTRGVGAEVTTLALGTRTRIEGGRVVGIEYSTKAESWRALGIRAVYDLPGVGRNLHDHLRAKQGPYD
jgi:hypothetical protein